MMKDLIKEHELSFVCLLEMHVAGDKAMRIVQRMGLGAHNLESARGHSGGIWCSWDPGKWTVTVCSTVCSHAGEMALPTSVASHCCVWESPTRESQDAMA